MRHPSRRATPAAAPFQAPRGVPRGAALAPEGAPVTRQPSPITTVPMRPIRTLTLLVALAAAPVLAGCVDVLSPGGPDSRVKEDALLFPRASGDAPPLDALEVSFWAKPGATRGGAVRYVGVANPKYSLCMEFTVPAGSLLRHPDGRAVQPGDSVRITVRVLDPEGFRFEFAPAGLRFDASNPARLRVSYWWADRDFDGDGRTDADDARVEESLGFWKQERPGERWTRVVTQRSPDDYELVAGIAGFTRYAVASNRSADTRFE